MVHVVVAADVVGNHDVVMLGHHDNHCSAYNDRTDHDAIDCYWCLLVVVGVAVVVLVCCCCLRGR